MSCIECGRGPEYLNFNNMNSVQNSVHLIGNLGQDPNFYESEKGGKFIRLRLATNEVYTAKDGEKVTKTYWHTCIANGKLAESLKNNTAKGRKLAIQGQLQYSQYTDKQGIERVSAEIRIKDYALLDKQPQAAVVD